MQNFFCHSSADQYVPLNPHPDTNNSILLTRLLLMCVAMVSSLPHHSSLESMTAASGRFLSAVSRILRIFPLLLSNLCVKVSADPLHVIEVPSFIHVIGSIYIRLSAKKIMFSCKSRES